MPSLLMKRLEKLEESLAPPQKLCPIIGGWGDDPEVIDDKLARWRAGEDIEGAPNDIEVEDRENAFVVVLVSLKPKPPNERP